MQAEQSQLCEPLRTGEMHQALSHLCGPSVGSLLLAVRGLANGHLEGDLPKKTTGKANKKTPMFTQTMGLKEHLQAAREGGQVNVLLCNLHTTLIAGDFDFHNHFNSRI